MSSSTPIEESPTSFSLEAYCPSLYDQGGLGSATALAICSCIMIMDNTKNNTKNSRLYLYTNDNIHNKTKTGKIPL